MQSRSARDAFHALTEAWARHDWQVVSNALDPDDINAFRDRELAVLTDRAAIYAAARREGRRITGWSSNAVLDLQMLAELGSEPQVPFPGAPTLSELASFSPTAFLIACLEAQAAAGDRLAAKARSSGLIGDPGHRPAPSRRVIGELTEGDDLVHILFRRVNGDSDDHPTHVYVRTLRRVRGEWRVCLDHELRMRVSPMFAFHDFEEPPELSGPETA